MRPLADEIRPLDLDEVVGQKHILGPGGLLRRVIESGNIPNMVFYGPSGTGKTTVANIIARRTDRTLRRLNATNASLSDVKGIIGELDTLLTPGGVLLYLDEIQYFNKKQQQSLLEFIEDGRITLIASTTENPYFYVYNALLSRSTVFEFKSVEPVDIIPAIERAVNHVCASEGISADMEPGVTERLAMCCGGDVRKAINGVELLFARVGRDESEIYPHALHGDGKEVEGASVYGGACDDVIARARYIEHRKEIGGLPRGGEHGGGASFEGAYLCRHRIVGGVLQSGVEIARRFQIEELRHGFAGLVTEGRALHDGYLPGLTVCGGVAALYA